MFSYSTHGDIRVKHAPVTQKHTVDETPWDGSKSVALGKISAFRCRDRKKYNLASVALHLINIHYSYKSSSCCLRLTCIASPLSFLSTYALTSLFSFSIQLYRVFSVSSAGNLSHFEHCSEREQLHVPALFIILGHVNHLLLVFNSSVNVLIYYCGGKTFRKTFKELFWKLIPSCSKSY